MGLSSFPSSSEGLLPMVAVTVAYVITFFKNTAKSLRLVEEDEEELEDQVCTRRRILVTRFKAAVAAAAEEECCVCLSRFKAEEEVSELVSCKHFFHRWCLQRWFDNCINDTTPCPLCRSLR